MKETILIFLVTLLNLDLIKFMLIIMKKYLVLENQLLFRWHAPSGKKMWLNTYTFGDIKEFNYFDLPSY